MKRKNTALVLIDLQKESNFGLDHMEQVTQNAKQLIDSFHALQMPVIYTRQINRSDRAGLSLGEPLNQDGTPFFYNNSTENIDIIDEIKPQKEDIIIDKYRWSAFYQTSLDLMLRNLQVTDLIIGGVVTDGCLMTSVYDAYFRDYNIHLVKDICTASNEGAHMSAMMIMANWIYNLEIYDTSNLLKRVKGENYYSWKADKVDTMQFTPENMRNMYNNIQ
ncbi:cysteine hydrolase family protein [Gracilibacillus halophilus]|nr:isochorismatase family cysteine hydrolase [Gracilibacillus halophilus]